MWTGLILGSTMAALAMSDGVRLRIGSGLPGWLSLFLGGVVVWLITVGFVALVAEVLRRNRQPIARAGGRQVRRAGRAGRRHAGRARRAAIRRGESWAGRRWEARNAPAGDDAIEPGPGDEGDDAPGAGDRDDALPRPGGRVYPAHPVYGPGPWLMRGRSRGGRVINPLGNGGRGSSEDVVAVYDPADLDRRLGAAGGDPDLDVQVRPMPKPDDTDPGWPAWDDAPGAPPPAGPGPACSACGEPGGGDLGPLVSHPGGDPAHQAHFEDPGHDLYGLYGHLYIPPPSGDGADAGGQQADGGITDSGGSDMTTETSGFGPGARRGRAPAMEPAVAWKELIARTADYEPEDDAQLLAWMAGEAAGMAGYAESMATAYETAVNSVGLDPAAMSAMHDYADSVAEAAQQMAAARQKFAEFYAEVRNFTAAGNKLPYDGRWITGEGG